MINFGGSQVDGGFRAPLDCCYCCGARIYFGPFEKNKPGIYINHGVTIAVDKKAIPRDKGTNDDEITSLDFGHFHVQVALSLTERPLSDSEDNYEDDTW